MSWLLFLAFTFFVGFQIIDTFAVKIDYWIKWIGVVVMVIVSILVTLKFKSIYKKSPKVSHCLPCILSGTIFSLVLSTSFLLKSRIIIGGVIVVMSGAGILFNLLWSSELYFVI